MVCDYYHHTSFINRAVYTSGTHFSLKYIIEVQDLRQTEYNIYKEEGFSKLLNVNTIGLILLANI